MVHLKSLALPRGCLCYSVPLSQPILHVGKTQWALNISSINKTCSLLLQTLWTLGHRNKILGHAVDKPPSKGGNQVTFQAEVKWIFDLGAISPEGLECLVFVTFCNSIWGSPRVDLVTVFLQLLLSALLLVPILSLLLYQYSF